MEEGRGGSGGEGREGSEKRGVGGKRERERGEPARKGRRTREEEGETVYAPMPLTLFDASIRPSLYEDGTRATTRSGMLFVGRRW